MVDGLTSAQARELLSARGSTIRSNPTLMSFAYYLNVADATALLEEGVLKGREVEGQLARRIILGDINSHQQREFPGKEVTWLWTHFNLGYPAKFEFASAADSATALELLTSRAGEDSRIVFILLGAGRYF